MRDAGSADSERREKKSKDTKSMLEEDRRDKVSSRGMLRRQGRDSGLSGAWLAGPLYVKGARNSPSQTTSWKADREGLYRCRY